MSRTTPHVTPKLILEPEEPWEAEVNDDALSGDEDGEGTEPIWTRPWTAYIPLFLLCHDLLSPRSKLLPGTSSTSALALPSATSVGQRCRSPPGCWSDSEDEDAPLAVTLSRCPSVASSLCDAFGTWEWALSLGARRATRAVVVCEHRSAGACFSTQESVTLVAVLPQKTPIDDVTLGRYVRGPAPRSTGYDSGNNSEASNARVANLGVDGGTASLPVASHEKDACGVCAVPPLSAGEASLQMKSTAMAGWGREVQRTRRVSSSCSWCPEWEMAE
ncbi:hypothetical protein B0H10DRAFT_2213140 [Mycena sp. CBHHK59/15]|nr:hypothetical protein B0H10DRAFT_2213140 [Mycena sp. CBHHK59/15]